MVGSLLGVHFFTIKHDLDCFSTSYAKSVSCNGMTLDPHADGANRAPVLQCSLNPGHQTI